MKQIYLVKKGTTLVPAFPDDEAVLNKFGDGEVLRCALRKAHSPKQHRFVFAIARTVLSNAPEDDSVLARWGMLYRNNPERTTYNFVKMCEIELGYFDTFVKPDGSIQIVPMSLSYDEMDKDEFNSFANQFIELCSQMLGISNEELILNYEEV